MKFLGIIKIILEALLLQRRSRESGGARSVVEVNGDVVVEIFGEGFGVIEVHEVHDEGFEVRGFGEGLECNGDVLRAVAGEFEGEEVRGEEGGVEGECGEGNAVERDGGSGGGDGGDVLSIRVAG